MMRSKPSSVLDAKLLERADCCRPTSEASDDVSGPSCVFTLLDANRRERRVKLVGLRNVVLRLRTRTSISRALEQRKSDVSTSPCRSRVSFLPRSSVRCVGHVRIIYIASSHCAGPAGGDRQTNAPNPKQNWKGADGFDDPPARKRSRRSSSSRPSRMNGTWPRSALLVDSGQMKPRRA